MMPEPADYSVAALRWFSDQLPEISELPIKTARSTGLAIRTILATVTLEDSLDVRTIDAVAVLGQFEDATTERYTVNT